MAKLYPSMENLSHEYIEKLRLTHPALRLLNADNAPLIISFLYRTFIQTNRRSISYSELHSKLNDFLYFLQGIYGEDKYPREPKAYIDEWTSERCEFLRQYYTTHADEPELDLTPATEKAIEWLLSLEQKQFIGAESRLLTLFQILRSIIHETEENPVLRINELERQKAEIDLEIRKIQHGNSDKYDARQIKERFLQAEETARKLLSDFRQVEHNFRILDRGARERIATNNEQKGKLLDNIFQEQDVIQDSDQGRSFKAFWELLMSPTSQDELKKLLKTTFTLKEVQELNPSALLNQIDLSLLIAGEKVYKTSALLGEQLRKFLETQAYLENRRILEIIKKIEKQAIELKANPPKEKFFSEVDSISPDINLIMSRTLFIPPKNPIIEAGIISEGKSDVSSIALYHQVYVDEDELMANIKKALQSRTQITLRELISLFPATKGLEEVIAYFNIASKDPYAFIDGEVMDSLHLAAKKIQAPQVIFTRK